MKPRNDLRFVTPYISESLQRFGLIASDIRQAVKARHRRRPSPNHNNLFRNLEGCLIGLQQRFQLLDLSTAFTSSTSFQSTYFLSHKNGWLFNFSNSPTLESV